MICGIIRRVTHSLPAGRITLNYRHSFHAGNIADVFKHHVLTRMLAALHRKDSAFCVVDSHAGSGAYRLEPPGEFEQGIGRLWPVRQAWPALSDYFHVIEKLNPDGGLLNYPGSPFIIRDFLRPQDRAVLLELHPEECAELKTSLDKSAAIAVHHTDAWNGLKAFVPPKENRGLVLIDPPFEKRDEFRQIMLALDRCLKHWRNGIYMAWYPIKGPALVEQFYRELRALKVEAWAVEFMTLPRDMEQRLNGSGLVLVNPPWGLLDSLKQELPPLAAFFAGSAGRPEVRVIALP